MTIKELVKMFADHCGDCERCFRCRFYHRCISIGECLEAYIKQIHSGEMKPEDSFEEATEGGRE